MKIKDKNIWILVFISFIIELIWYFFIILPKMLYCPPGAECAPISSFATFLGFFIFWFIIYFILLLSYHLIKFIKEVKDKNKFILKLMYIFGHTYRELNDEKIKKVRKK